jgi:hypothetical protein
MPRRWPMPQSYWSRRRYARLHGAGVALAFPMQSAGSPRLTADGLALFDRTVDYAADGCP